MPIERRRPPVAIETDPRSTLAHVHHKEIDAILKDLKFCSRRLKSALDSFRDELRTLERLYYKCKNQHRAALFFKRVIEVRRYGGRLSELDILERIDLVRASFVGLKHTNDSKALRSSWSHVPQKPAICFLMERLTACSTLVCKMRERLEKAYHHFALAMQTGAFVQLLILFVAISSRMSVLSSQLDEILQLSISTCNRLLVIVHPTGTHVTNSQRVPTEPETSRPIDHDLPPEDTGQLVSHRESIDVSTFAVEEPNSNMEAALPTSQSTNADDFTTGRTLKKITAKAVQESRPKKAKKKLDEIDEIFGF